MKSVFTRLLFAGIICSLLYACSNGEGGKPPGVIKRRLLLTHADSVRADDQAKAELEEEN